MERVGVTFPATVFCLHHIQRERFVRKKIFSRHDLVMVIPCINSYVLRVLEKYVKGDIIQENIPRTSGDCNLACGWLLIYIIRNHSDVVSRHDKSGV